MIAQNYTPEQLLRLRSVDYTPSTFALYGDYNFASRKPPFRLFHVHDMLKHPHVQLGLRIIKGRILSRARFFIKEKNLAIKDFLIDQITRFWSFSASRQLDALEWGYSGSEVVYKVDDGKIQFSDIKNFHPRDIHVITSRGAKVGLSLNRMNQPNTTNRSKLYIGGPKSLWHVVNRQWHPWYGHSLLYGAYDPWYESWKDGGARDIRNLYYYKYAFSGDSLYYPPGQSGTTDPTDPYRANRDLARTIVERKRTGGVTIFPNTTDQNGNKLWEWVPASPGPGTADILEYNDVLKTEILEGMGIPREVVEASETGSGYSGRRVPSEAFDSTLQEYVNWLIHDFDEQVLQPLVRLNFGHDPTHEIQPFGLRRGSKAEAEMESGQPPQLPEVPDTSQPPKAKTETS